MRVKISALIVFFILISGCRQQPEGKIVLRFWHGIESPENNRLLQKKIEEFENKYPDIKINPQNFGAQDKAMPKIMTAVSAGRQPELLWLAPMHTGRLAESGRLVAAEKFFNDPAFDPDNIYEGLLETGSYKDKIYTVPFESNCLAVYYNKEHFRREGINKPPQTWEQLKEVAAKLTVNEAGDGNPDRYGLMLPLGNEEWTVWTWQTFLWQAGGKLFTEDFSQPAFHKDEGRRALDFWVDMIEEPGIATLSSRNAGYKLEPFLAGSVSMVINGPWNYSVLKDQTAVEYGSFKLPADKKQATNIGGENLYIFSSTEEKQEASWKFARYIMSEDFQTEWAMKTGYLPVNRKSAESKEYKRFLKGNPFIETYVQSMDFGKARPPLPEYSRISKRIGDALEKALYLQQDPAEALREAAEKVRELL